MHIRTLSHLFLATFAFTHSAIAFEPIQVGEWRIHHLAEEGISACEAGITTSDGRVGLRMIAGSGEVTVSMWIDQQVPDLSNVTISFGMSPKSGTDINVGGPVSLNDLDGSYETSIPDREKFLQHLETAFYTSADMGSWGWFTLPNADGFPLAKAFRDCLRDIESPELERTAQDAIAFSNRPKQNDQTFFTLISLASRLEQVSKICSDWQQGFTTEDTENMTKKRVELMSAWTSPDENYIEGLRVAQLETNAITSKLNPSDCAEIRYRVDDHMKMLAKATPDKLMSSQN